LPAPDKQANLAAQGMRTVDLIDFQIWRLKRVGFWWSDDEPEFPHPSEYVDESWDPLERDRAIIYLEQCYYLTRIACGYSWCRFGCELSAEMGHGEYTDHVWLFPEGFLHYVRHHAVKPPHEFLEHMRKTNFKVP
jgi:hypothetical protein